MPCLILYEHKRADCVNNTALTIREPDRPGKPADAIPPGEVWFLIGGHIHNGDDETRNCTVNIRDSADSVVFGLVSGVAVAAGQFISYPTATAIAREWRGGYYVPLFSGERFWFYWAAPGVASAGGECRYSYRVVVYKISDLKTAGIDVEAWGYRDS